MHRVGVIPFDIKGDAIAVLFVTSQSRGRWILPKGLIKPGESKTDACLREGFEEAGIKGHVLDDFATTVLINKQTDEGKLAVPVTYFPMLVSEQVDEWPEMEKRERHWALLKDASKVTYREDYLGLINQFEALAPWVKKAAEAHK